MPFLVIPLIFLVVGLVIVAVMMLMFGLIHLILPLIVIFVIWQLIRGAVRGQRPTSQRSRTDWQSALHQNRPRPTNSSSRPQRKQAEHVKEEPSGKHHDDDWSDF